MWKVLEENYNRIRAEKDAEFASVLEAKDAIIAEKEAEIEKLRMQLAEAQK